MRESYAGFTQQHDSLKLAWHCCVACYEVDEVRRGRRYKHIIPWPFVCFL